MHRDTGEDFTAAAHALLTRAKKVECMQRLYWERGGRTRRLARYTKKRAPKPKQLTLYDATVAGVADDDCSVPATTSSVEHDQASTLNS